jgi:uncharacterized protein YodC (DUF2158 family)
MNPGDTVQLKSGGPVMTIARLEEMNGGTLAVCDWFVGNEQKRGSFQLTSLKPAAAPAPAVAVGRPRV